MQVNEFPLAVETCERTTNQVQPDSREWIMFVSRNNFGMVPRRDNSQLRNYVVSIPFENVSCATPRQEFRIALDVLY